MADEKEIIDKILNYWYMQEFLTQENFPKSESTEKIIKECKKDSQKKSEEPKWVSTKVTGEILDTVRFQTEQCQWKYWSKIAFYAGSIRRTPVVKAMAERMGAEIEEQPEESKDRMALFSLQVSETGTYLYGSFSLSPVLWALKQISSKGDDIVQKMNCFRYAKCLHEMEIMFFDNPDEEESYKVTQDKIKQIYNYIKRVYVDDIPDNEVTFSCVGKYCMFSSEENWDSYNEEIYSSLSGNFFSEEIRMLIEKNEKDQLDNKMKDYIIALYRDAFGDVTKNRKDLVHSHEREDEYLCLLNGILRVGNAPLGKWPSQYMPVLMQQVAINLLLRRDSEKTSDGHRKIFSVNGPPGTGKTTLLKEIIVNNVVERAALLAEEENPDAAFTAVNFEYGDKEDKRYSDFIPCWYKLKNDKINDYSIMVVSSNNNAVENISKELPVYAGIFPGLKPQEGTEQEIDSLEEVRRLFAREYSEDKEEVYRWKKDNENNTQQKETVEKKETGEKAENDEKEKEKENRKRDIYFSEYTNGLLGTNNTAWGLIAAPLGKKRNIAKFYYEVLYYLLVDLLSGNEEIENRREKYLKARQKFNEQYVKVKQLQEELDAYGEVLGIYVRSKEESEEIISRNKKMIARLEEKLREIQLQANMLEKEYVAVKEETNTIVSDCISENEELKQKQEKTEAEIVELEKEISGINDEISRMSIARMALEECEISWFDKIFRKKKLNERAALIDKYNGEIAANETQLKECSTQIGKNNWDIFQIEKRQRENNERKKKAEEAEEKIKQEYKEELKVINQKHQEIDNHRYAVSVAENQKEIATDNYRKKMQALTKRSKEKLGVVLDMEYIRQIFSADNETATKAQVENPWISEEFNREREKLFYYAMKLNKEFVLSSKSCRNNLKTLGQYWGYRKGDEKERIIFKESTKSGFVKALLQTLFLLVPVTSSTFASIGRFLREAPQNDVIGLIIVDEAGQAVPQMALGALHRSRRAMIVGDPKQIDPVVTDELKLLREAYKEDLYIPYKDKTVSVQKCADILNPYGTYMDDGSGAPEWVGCPLLVHRRCISPMFDISNELSYGGIMKQQTKGPDPKLEETFIYKKSQWIDVEGAEKGAKNHFVEAQGKIVCEMLRSAFERNEIPSLFIISPFKSVEEEMKGYIKKYFADTEDNMLRKRIMQWMKDNIGTVHTFQGKEANEVIFLLGCDNTAKGAIHWVSKNIVNVAVTRAKYRLYVVGSKTAWLSSGIFKIVERHLK